MDIYVVFRRYITLVPHKLSISALESCLESQVFQSLQELCPVNEICRLANAMGCHISSGSSGVIEVSHCEQANSSLYRIN